MIQSFVLTDGKPDSIVSPLLRATYYRYYDGSTTSTSDTSHRTQELRGIEYGDSTPASSYTYKRSGQIATHNYGSNARPIDELHGATVGTDLAINSEFRPEGSLAPRRRGPNVPRMGLHVWVANTPATQSLPATSLCPPLKLVVPLPLNDNERTAA